MEPPCGWDFTVAVLPERAALQIGPGWVRCGPVPGDVELLDRLRGGDEKAFAEMVERYHPRLVRFAWTFVSSRQTAEDVAQDTWVAVIRGVERFEGRSSFATWLYGICANRAKTRGGSDARAVPVGTGGATVSRDRFDAAGGWIDPPEPWGDVDDRLSAESLAPLVRAAIGDLPDLQRQVVTFRDVEGLTSRETCEVLSISEANQRVLLHRARSACALWSRPAGRGSDVRFLTPDLACVEAVELVTDYLEGRLSRRNRRRFESHIAGCPNCRTYFEQIKQTIALAGRVEPEQLDPEVLSDLTDLFRRYTQDDS